MMCYWARTSPETGEVKMVKILASGLRRECEKWFILHCYSPLSYGPFEYSVLILLLKSRNIKQTVLSALCGLLCTILHQHPVSRSHFRSHPTIHLHGNTLGSLPVRCRPSNTSTITPPMAIQRIQITYRIRLSTGLPCIQDSNPGASCCEMLSH